MGQRRPGGTLLEQERSERGQREEYSGDDRQVKERFLRSAAGMVARGGVAPAERASCGGARLLEEDGPHQRERQYDLYVRQCGSNQSHSRHYSIGDASRKVASPP